MTASTLPADGEPRTLSETVPGPSTAGGVVLDIGADIGALVLTGPPDLNGQEIEISRDAFPEAARTHSRVRERRLGSQGAAVVYAAVYPGLQSGVYTIWRDADTPGGMVTIDGGQVTYWRWQSG